MATVKTADKVKRQGVFLITRNIFGAFTELTPKYKLVFVLMIHTHISYTLVTAYHSNLIIFKEMYSYGTS